MPLIKSAIKKMRKDSMITARNLSVRSNLKTLIAKAIKTADQEVVRSAISSIDTAAKKNLIHKNTASRKKSKLMSLLSKGPSVAQAKTKTVASKKRVAKAKPKKK